MATFTTIADTVLEPGKPIRSVDALALRDNPIAIAGGAVGAPRIVTNAIQDENVTTSKLATNERMTTGNVLASTASASAGAVGTYVFAQDRGDLDFGGTIAGSALQAAGILAVRFGTFTDSNIPGSAAAGVDRGSALSGTWRCMGVLSNASVDGVSTLSIGGTATLFLRIS